MTAPAPIPVSARFAHPARRLFALDRRQSGNGELQLIGDVIGFDHRRILGVADHERADTDRPSTVTAMSTKIAIRSMASPSG